MLRLMDLKPQRLLNRWGFVCFFVRTYRYQLCRNLTKCGYIITILEVGNTNNVVFQEWKHYSMFGMNCLPDL